MGAIGVPAVPQANADERHRWGMAGPSIERIGHNPPYTGRCGSSRMPCPLEGGQAGHPGRGRFTDREPRSAYRG